MGPTSLSRGLGRHPHHWTCPAEVGSLSRGQNITQKKLKESQMESKDNDHSNGKRYTIKDVTVATV
jgi:hypothetical protein